MTSGPRRSVGISRKPAFVKPFGHDAFTIIELVVVLSIISILLALTLAGALHARKTTRTAQCSDRMRQVLLAVHTKHSKERMLPTNGRWQEGSTYQGTTISTFVFSQNRLHPWGVGNPDLNLKEQTGCWAYSLLPEIDQSQSYQKVLVGTEIELYRCPSRSRFSGPVPSQDQFGRYVSAGVPWSRTDFAANSLVASNEPEYYRFASVTDGLSNTMWAAEKAFDPIAHGGTTWYYDEGIFTGGSGGTARSGDLIVPDRNGVNFIDNWGAPHSDSMTTGMLDGSVQATSRFIDFKVFYQMRAPQSSSRLIR